jgi:hypothetical protein
MAFLALELTELTELEILNYSKAKLTYLANANNVQSSGCSAVILREKLIAQRNELLALLQEEDQNREPPDPNALAAPPGDLNANIETALD